MPDEPPTEEEGQLIAAVATGILATLMKKDGRPKLDEAAELMAGAEFDCGDGKTISFDSPEVKARLSWILRYLADDTREITQYLFEHPGRHSAQQLAKATGADDIFVETILYKLLKAGIVREPTVGYSVQVNKNGDAIAAPAPVGMYQIDPAVWLKEVRSRRAADDGAGTNNR